MKRFLSLALAGLLAASAITACIAPAAADGPRQYQYWQHPHPGPGPGGWHGDGHWHGDHGGWNAGGAFVGGTFLGLALGATLASPPPPPPPAYVYAAPPTVYYAPPPAYPRYVYADHIAWCAAHYPGYNGETDTFVAADGITYRCAAPY